MTKKKSKFKLAEWLYNPVSGEISFEYYTITTIISLIQIMMIYTAININWYIKILPAVGMLLIILLNIVRVSVIVYLVHKSNNILDLWRRTGYICNFLLYTAKVRTLIFDNILFNILYIIQIYL